MTETGAATTPPMPPNPPQYQQPVPAPVPAGSKNRITAGILALLLGGLGVHKFYLGYTASGVIMLLVSILTVGLLSPVISVIALVEGILYLTKSDEEFHRIYVAGKKAWF